jgi:DNA-binding HxlR family transcriptional regulator
LLTLVMRKVSHERLWIILPLSQSCGILTERWTPLVLRELLLGSRHFNELRRGIPQMSPTLISKRLQTLEEAGLISRQSGDNGHWEYHPTQAAREAWPIIDAMGYWGHKWAHSQLTPSELHAGRLMWNMRRSFDLKHIPSDFVLHIEIADARLKRWWFVVKKEEADLCWDDPCNHRHRLPARLPRVPPDQKVGSLSSERVPHGTTP